MKVVRVEGVAKGPGGLGAETCKASSAIDTNLGFLEKQASSNGR